MESFLRGLELQEYYPRFMAQGIDDVSECRAERRLDALLDSVGMTSNPGHVEAFKTALFKAGGDDAGGGWRSNNKKSKKSAAAPVDPAEAIRQAMAASKARGGGAIGGGAAAKRPAPSAAGAATAAVNNVDRASEEEMLEILLRARSKDPLKLLGLPGAPVDVDGKVTWENHPAMRSNDVAMRAKIMSMRCDPSRFPAGDAARDKLRAVAEDAHAAVLAAAATLQDPDARKAALTLAVQRRVDEMRRVDQGGEEEGGETHGGGALLPEGGYVTATGVHFAAGAAIARVADAARASETGHGPMMNPALAVGRAMAAANKAGDERKSEGKSERERGGEGEGEGEGDEARERARAGAGGGGGGGEREGKVDLSALRDKLKKKRPSFM